MMINRLLIAFTATLLASGVSTAQTSMIEPTGNIIAETIVDGLAQPVISGTKPNSGTTSLPEATMQSIVVPAEVPTVDAVYPVQNQVIDTDAIVSPRVYQASNPVYSPKRDGLPTLQQRRQLRAMPIQQRPNRLMHFYGNTVRRRMGR